MPTGPRLAMTVGDLLTNPPGRGTRHVAARYMIRASLDAIYRQAMADPARSGRFSARACAGRADGSFVFLVRVPSAETPADFDVVLQLDYGTSAATSQARCRVYCNSPGWVFTYGYVAAATGLLAPGWEAALGAAVTGTPPRQTNPGRDFGYDKVVHQGVMYLLGGAGVLTRRDAERLAAGGRPVLPAEPRLSAEAKLKEYQRMSAEAARGRRAEKKAAAAEAGREAAGRSAGARAPAGTSKSRPAARSSKAAGRPARSASSGTAPAAGGGRKR